ncbi:OB-fold domain-containing protein [Halomarina oriensis]|uniref:Nucleic acid-binding protein n=1 Tax=Halomarina oriensis TaxID=671145 RepID=A0A6B0GIJ7_9EURY|nr:OB-fold domain-containing protein [Halomarina oriensis]MWG33631.1 nucleic acid-binding protein [Halomarina oriensis]
MSEDDERHGTDTTHDEDGTDDDRTPFEAVRYADGSLGYPGHPVGPDGSEPVGTVDLSEHTARVVTWTTATSPPPGVRSPNHLAIVEFDVDGEPIRALGQLTTGDVAIGDEVRPVYAAELRDPEAGIRDPESQEWDGYRFEPV